MVEEDAPVVEDELHAHHHHGTGIKWLDIILASSAILISVVSLIVSVNHGRTMERLVEENALQVKATTLPILRFGTGNLDTATSKPTVHFDITNGGTGPAVIEWLGLSYAGRPVANVRALLDACCRTDHARTLGLSITNVASGQTLPAGQSITLFSAVKQGSDPATYAVLEQRGRFGVGVRACYCSVLDQCWLTDFRQTRPQPIADCRSSRPPARW